LNTEDNTLSSVGANGKNVQDWDLNNVAPRFGLAVRITPKTVFRGGWGLNYFQVPIMYSGYMPAMFGTFQGVAGGFTTVQPFNSGTFPG
jgi:hypothetical protein